MNPRHSLWAAALLSLTLLACLALPALAEEVKGKVAAVQPDKSQVVVTEGFKNWVFKVTPGCRIFLNDRESKLTELRAGDEALVTFSREGEKLSASIVRCMRK